MVTGSLRSSLRNMEARYEHGAEDVEYVNAQDEQNNQIEAGKMPIICVCRRPQSPFGYFPPNFLLTENNRNDRIDLFTAALNGVWKAAESIMERDASYVNSSVTEEFQTALHVAAGAKHTDFVKKLVNRRQANLRLQDKNGNTAFCHAVMAGSIPVAEFMLVKDGELALIRGGQNSIPLFIAVIFGHHDMARLLFQKTETHLDHSEWEDLEEIFFTCIETNMFDIALKLLSRYGGLAVARNADKQTALHLLARKPSAFDSKRPGIVEMLSNLCTYKESDDNTALEIVKSLWKNFLQKYTRENVRAEILFPYNLLLKAAELGNYKFLAALIRHYPELIWETDDENRTIFHIAVMHRQANIFNQIYSIGSIKDVLVTYQIPLPSDPSVVSDNMLHLAAKIPLSHELNAVPGSALQMQRELLWFEEVKSILQPCEREKQGSEGLTPRQIFSREHKNLLEEGKKWMRDTATSCLIVATIITIVAYYAGFSIPGGYNDSTSGCNVTIGSPVLINHNLFHVFAVSEAIALSFSITSMLIFLFILTSRYTEEDFLKSLPGKL
ncbi:hypothetical protein DITRI_Ditri02bG0150800 [Diplodiscus trichospermus]